MGTGDEEGACGGFNWVSIYPHWWWSCNHKVTDRECIYCWRQYQSQPFGDQYSYYLASAQTCQPPGPLPAAGIRSDQSQGHGLGPIHGLGLPQGLSYNIPARDAPANHHHHPPGHGLSHERVRARASHPVHLETHGKVLTLDVVPLWHLILLCLGPVAPHVIKVHFD